MKEPIIGRELVKKNTDVWYDKVFVRHLIKKVQDIDPDIGAFLYPDQKLIVFWWKRIIIYKILMNEDQTNNLTLDYHLDKIKTVLRMLKANLLPLKDLNIALHEVKNIKYYGKRLS